MMLSNDEKIKKTILETYAKFLNIEYLKGKLDRVGELGERGYSIRTIDQNSSECETLQAVKNYRSILRYVYGYNDGVAGYPVMKTETDMIEKIRGGKIIVIQIYENRSGICVTNSYVELHDGGFYLGGSGELPSGHYKIENEEIVRCEEYEEGCFKVNTDEIPSSVAMCLRIISGLEQDKEIKFIDAHCRCSKGGKMPDGTELGSGAASVHITHKTGLSPFALLPAFRIVKPIDENGSILHRADWGLLQMAYLTEKENIKNKIYIPQGENFVEMKNQIQILMNQVVDPDIIEVEIEDFVEPKFEINFNGLFFEIAESDNGKDLLQIKKEFESESRSPYLQFSLENSLGNVGMIKFLLDNGFTFCGVQPGIKETETTLFFGLLSVEGRSKLPEIDLPESMDEMLIGVFEEIDKNLRKISLVQPD